MNFKDREEAFERKFALDEELRFKALARRDKLLGLWAAEKLGKSGDAASEYARQVVSADFNRAGDADVFDKVRADLDAAGANVSEEELRTKMRELLVIAAEQVLNT
jgi:hypothetical protein